MAALPSTTRLALCSLRPSTSSTFLRSATVPFCRPQCFSTATRLVAGNVARAESRRVTPNNGVQGVIQQRRNHQTPSKEQRSKIWEFEDIQRLITSPPTSSTTPTSPTTTILIDVREPSEVSSTGTIPTAYNIPLSSNPDALLLQPDEFFARFGFHKPPPTTELVFYCKAGVRSSAAAQIARQGGYERVGEYRGSWLDWERRGGVSSKGDRAPKGQEVGEGWERVGGV